MSENTSVQSTRSLKLREEFDTDLISRADSTATVLISAKIVRQMR